ncbi:hypothetical protein EYUKI_246 [Bacillus phage Eyuki]|nr:hypothetical protein QLX47_gp246 [Bacillus phage Eyuki]ALA46553.1 hypothetical protein EYUKI_246 [Bacillus phage Eyuki]
MMYELKNYGVDYDMSARRLGGK